MRAAANPTVPIATVMRTLRQTGVLAVLLAVLLLASAGDAGWPEAWAYVLEVALASVALELWLARVDPDLLRQRQAPAMRRGQKGLDRAFMVSATVLFAGWLVLIGTDARRFGWSVVPVPIELFGACVVASSFALVRLVYRHNSFAVTQVRLQPERAQHVIDTGPYGVVRHPMYSSLVLLCGGSTLMLGSWWGLLGVPAVAAAMSLRIAGEERMLRTSLAGYEAYAGRVRWRLVPFVW